MMGMQPRYEPLHAVCCDNLATVLEQASELKNVFGSRRARTHFSELHAVWKIYRYLSGIYHFLITFSSGMVWWYAKVVLVSFDLNSVSSDLISNSARQL